MRSKARRAYNSNESRIRHRMMVKKVSLKQRKTVPTFLNKCGAVFLVRLVRTLIDTIVMIEYKGKSEIRLTLELRR